MLLERAQLFYAHKAIHKHHLKGIIISWVTGKSSSSDMKRKHAKAKKLEKSLGFTLFLRL